MNKLWKPQNPKRTLKEMIHMFSNEINIIQKFSKDKASIKIIADYPQKGCSVKITVDGTTIWDYTVIDKVNKDNAIYQVCGNLIYNLLQGNIVFPYKGKARNLIAD
jgi:predicted Rdx family selenoprotein